MFLGKKDILLDFDGLMSRKLFEMADRSHTHWQDQSKQ